MNTVTVLVQDITDACVYHPRKTTADVNEAMGWVYEAWSRGRSACFSGPFGTRLLEPPIESVISQLPDDSQARHDRNRARWK